MATSRSVLITGCSSGIGEATARRLVGSGWTVWATARRPETLESLAAAGCRTLALDVTDEDSMRSAVDEALGHGPIDALVNNAGYSQSGAVETLTSADLRRQFETNVVGLVRMCQLVLPSMRDRRSGRIVNISSMGAHLTFPGGGAYHASKYAVNALSDALRFEVSGFGVKVVTVEPGLITTSFDEAAAASLTGLTDGPYAEFNAGVGRATQEVYSGPMARLGGPPEKVAKVIEKSLTVRRPKPRYTVTASAPLSMATRTVLGDRGWDLAMRTSFPRPGA
ncbi:short chain dehydrogenase [Aeromicrobium marinum DSM 15272]|uniref:Short chain dehydrogenase n=1 Tax=Aeromicrobium marinum DSM 15272 TaxID=585531 RepID=E2SBB0_9ACTN|nr:SDR family NAD(P)-dependent oxidoreductase [Aeromicrobium marinum]EFQ83656.1 short chain dehydrogenase [Aeromicrobium marinum DSM 15272]